MTIQLNIDKANDIFKLIEETKKADAAAGRLYYIACVRRPTHPRGEHTGRLTGKGCVQVYFNEWEAFEQATRLNFEKQTPHAYYEPRVL